MKQLVVAVVSMLGTVAMVSGLMAADVTLTWTANTEADLAGYNIYQSTVSGQYGPPVRTVGKVTQQTVTVPQSQVETTYYFALTAYDLTGNESTKSAPVSILIPGVPPPVALLPPANLRYDAGTIRWDAVAQAMGGYYLRVHEAGTPYDPCSAMLYCNETVGTLMTTSKTLVFKPNTVYDMWIHSVATDGTMSASNGSSFTTPAAPVDLPPAQPQGLQVVSQTAEKVVIVASTQACRRVLTSTSGSTSSQQKRTITCVK